VVANAWVYQHGAATVLNNERLNTEPNGRPISRCNLWFNRARSPYIGWEGVGQQQTRRYCGLGFNNAR